MFGISSRTGACIGVFFGLRLQFSSVDSTSNKNMSFYRIERGQNIGGIVGGKVQAKGGDQAYSGS